jgi:N-glycosylase/DNA lyase
LAERLFPVTEYNLEATLTSGQAFRWNRVAKGWVGIVRGRRVQLESAPDGILARAECEGGDWRWLEDYLQVQVPLREVLASFPADEHLGAAMRACAGLRLLRQEPWECLASFILSSTKQIVQIREIVEMVCQRFGPPLPMGGHAFPPPERVALATERELRDCKMGFRAPYLKGTAEAIVRGEVDLDGLTHLPTTQAREALVSLPGVGRKIADCVLLFAYGRQDAFPVDVWILKALRKLYFPKRRPTARRLLRFTETYFGPNAGYAQQYLFHYMRTQIGRNG